jgi:hypothetical protein
LNRVREYLILIGVAMLLSYAFVAAVVAYYRAYHFGVGPVAAARAIGFPFALVVALIVGIVARAIALRRGRRGVRAIFAACGTMVVVLALVFLIEWTRTSSDRESDRLGSAASRLTLAEADGRSSECSLRSQIVTFARSLA